MDIKEALTFDGLKYFYTQYIKPLKTGAFATVVNNATTTVENTVLDGRMGKTLADKDANLQNQINTLNSSLVHGYIKTKLDAAKQIHVFHVNFSHDFIAPPRVFCTPTYTEHGLSFIKPLTFCIGNATKSGFDIFVCSDNENSNECNLEFYWLAIFGFIHDN